MDEKEYKKRVEFYKHNCNGPVDSLPSNLKRSFYRYVWNIEKRRGTQLPQARYFDALKDWLFRQVFIRRIEIE